MNTRPNSNRTITHFAIGGLLSMALATTAWGGVLEAERGAPLPKLPEAIASFGAAVSDGALYVIGGHVGETHAHSKENLSYRFQRLSLDSPNGWEDLPGGVGLQSVALVAHDGMIYRVGGLTAKNAPSEEEDLHSVADFARFDPATNTWEELPPLPAPRSSHDAVVSNDYLYVVGGWQLRGRGNDRQWPANAWRVDLTSDALEWEAVPSPPLRVRAIDLAAADGRIYMFGGLRSDSVISDAVFSFDPIDWNWKEQPELPVNGFAVSAVGIGPDIYLSGKDGVVYHHEVGGRDWTEIGSFDTPRFFHRLVAADADTLVAIGGAKPGGPHLASLEAFRFQGESEAAHAYWEISYPGEAKGRQGMFLHEGAMYAFGGNNSLGQHDFEPENFLAEGYRFDLTAHTVEQAPAFPAKRQSMETAVVSGDNGLVGYAMGGFGHDGEVARAFDEIYTFDFGAGSWSEASVRLPHPMTQFGVCQYDGALWAVGGADFDPRRDRQSQFHILDGLWRMDLARLEGGFADSGVQLSTPRRAFGGALLGHHYYLVGGLTKDFQTVADAVRVNLETLEEEAIPSPAHTLIAPQMAAIEGKLYLAGGSYRNADGDLVRNQTVEVYDPQSKSWSVLIEELPSTMVQLQMARTEDGLVLYTTYVDGDNVAKFMEVRP